MTDYTTVSARAMLVTLTMSSWSARKLDKAVSREVNDAHAASAKAGRYNKHLLAWAKEYKTLISRMVAAREAHYGQTLPWADTGWRLLPTANYLQYMDAMRKEFAAMDALRADFMEAYPRLVDEAQRQHEALGRLWQREDYPTARAMRAKFSWALEWRPVPSAGDIRVDLPGDQLDAIRAQVEGRMRDLAAEAMAGAWARLHEAVARIRKAAGPDGIVRGTLVEHARETCDVLARLNVAQDERLEAMRARVEHELAVLSVEDLRQDEAVRADAARRAEDIMAAMGAFYAPPPADVA